MKRFIITITSAFLFLFQNNATGSTTKPEFCFPFCAELCTALLAAPCTIAAEKQRNPKVAELLRFIASGLHIANKGFYFYNNKNKLYDTQTNLIAHRHHLTNAALFIHEIKNFIQHTQTYSSTTKSIAIDVELESKSTDTAHALKTYALPLLKSITAFWQTLTHIHKLDAITEKQKFIATAAHAMTHVIEEYLAAPSNSIQQKIIGTLLLANTLWLAWEAMLITSESPVAQKGAKINVVQQKVAVQPDGWSCGYRAVYNLLQLRNQRPNFTYEDWLKNIRNNKPAIYAKWQKTGKNACLNRDEIEELLDYGLSKEIETSKTSDQTGFKKLGDTSVIPGGLNEQSSRIINFKVHKVPQYFIFYADAHWWAGKLETNGTLTVADSLPEWRPENKQKNYDFLEEIFFENLKKRSNNKKIILDLVGDE